MVRVKDRCNEIVKGSLEVPGSGSSFIRIQLKTFDNKDFIDIRSCGKDKSGVIYARRNGFFYSFSTFKQMILPALITFFSEHSS